MIAQKKKVLLGEISSYKAIVIAKFLKKYYSDIHLITYDYHRFTKFIHSKYSDKHYCLNAIPNEKVNYLNELSQLVKLNNIDVFLPIHSDTIAFIIENRHLFGKTIDYLGDISDYLKLHEKDNLLKTGKELSVRIPISYSKISHAQYPFVAKPNNLSSSKGVLYINNDKDLNKLKDKISSSYIFQEFIKGDGCGFSVYCKNGKILKEYGHKRLAEYPVSGGSSVYRTGYYHPDMINIAEKICLVVLIL